ncbi:MAG: 3-dehydroquinate synthase [Bacteroidota bacterium]
MKDISVRLGRGRNRSYTVSLRTGVIDALPASIDRQFPGQQVFVITDSNVRKLYGKRLTAAFDRAGRPALLLEIPAGEGSKNADLVYQVQTELLHRGVQRDSVIVAFGGGVVGDLAGFVAATVLRGIDFVQVPTSLLAQVDSSVGGKVGVDHPVGKNLIGAFHQPRAVYIDTALLRTLPERQFRSGLAEVVKIAAALDSGLFRYVSRHAARISKTRTEILDVLVARSVGLKALVVMKDEFETGVRKALNLGHTIGHALEAASGYSLLHGEAVSIGIAAESLLSVQLGLMRPSERATLLQTLRGLRLPITLPRIKDRQRFLDALHADKKSVRGNVRFVLPAGIGQCAIGVDVPGDLLDRILSQSGK